MLPHYIRKRLLRKLWYYGVIWVTEVMLMTNYSGNIVNKGITLKNMNGETVDNELDFNKKVQFKDNAGLSTNEHER